MTSSAINPGIPPGRSSQRITEWQHRHRTRFLIAAWAALAERALVNRLPEALGMTSLAALAAAWLLTSGF
jgi:hypothetical protein